MAAVPHKAAPTMKKMNIPMYDLHVWRHASTLSDRGGRGAE